MMKGETALDILLKHATPSINEGEFVFCSVTKPPQSLLVSAIATIKEHEGYTLILPKKLAEEKGIDFSYVAAWITLKIHSDLAAIGLTAAFSSALAQHKISCNVIAGYYHDHIFVPHNDGEKAVAILSNLATT